FLRTGFSKDWTDCTGRISKSGSFVRMEPPPSFVPGNRATFPVSIPGACAAGVCGVDGVVCNGACARSGAGRTVACGGSGSVVSGNRDDEGSGVDSGITRTIMSGNSGAGGRAGDGAGGGAPVTGGVAGRGGVGRVVGR